MAMVWIQRNAKYFVITFGVLVVLGMLFMDPTGGQATPQNTTNIGIINGVSIPLAEFRQELNQYQEQERNQSGVAPEGIKLVQMRKNLFDFKIRSVILAELVETYGLHASSDEMWNYLEQNPDPLIQSDTNFQSGGKFDKQKYLDFLNQPGTMGIPYMQYMLAQMKNSIIPETQLQVLTKNQFHQTHLELAFDDFQRSNQAKLLYYTVVKDSFTIDAKDTSDEKARAYFEAHPDSFFTEFESAKVGYIKLDISPSKNDTLIAFDLINELKERVKQGESFEELAISYSDDEASAENGGSLGGYQTKEAWVPQFSEVAFGLDSGEISDPVITEFGYHIIKCNGIQMDSVKKVDAQHILIKIQSTPETTDSLVTILESMKQNMEKNGSLEDLAKEKGLEFKVSPAFSKWNFAGLGAQEYVPGLHSFTFSPLAEDDKLSAVFQNDQSVYLFEKREQYPAGRNFESAKQKIKKLLATQIQTDNAKAELEKLHSKIKDLPDDQLPLQEGKAKLDTTDLISTQSWVQRVGYDQLAVHKIFSQKQGVWGPVYESEYGAVMAKVQDKKSTPLETLFPVFLEKAPKDVNYTITSLNKKWFESMMNSADVENNLDVVYNN